jgi:hypothetical protein
MFRTLSVVALALLLCDAPAQEKQPRARSWVGVFRHHPGPIDTEERMDAREKDEKIILQMVKMEFGSYSYGGNLGRSGYLLEIATEDLPKWKTAIDNLHKARTLKYYDRWGLDKNGFGLIPLPKK